MPNTYTYTEFAPLLSCIPRESMLYKTIPACSRNECLIKELCHIKRSHVPFPVQREFSVPHLSITNMFPHAPTTPKDSGSWSVIALERSADYFETASIEAPEAGAKTASGSTSAS